MDVESDKHDTRYYKELNERSDNFIELISEILKVLNEHKFKKHFDVLNVNIRLSGGVIGIFPVCKQDIEFEVELLFFITFSELMDKHHDLCESELSDREFEDQVQLLEQEYMQLFKGEFEKQKEFEVIYTNYDFEIID